jgi:hypothetical protein
MADGARGLRRGTAVGKRSNADMRRPQGRRSPEAEHTSWKWPARYCSDRKIRTESVCPALAAPANASRRSPSSSCLIGRVTPVWYLAAMLRGYQSPIQDEAGFDALRRLARMVDGGAGVRKSGFRPSAIHMGRRATHESALLLRCPASSILRAMQLGAQLERQRPIFGA